MRNDLAPMRHVQDSAMVQRVDSASTTAPQVTEPPFRTPQNVGFMQIAYLVAAVIYGGYLLILRRRWSALKKRQHNAAQSRR